MVHTHGKGAEVTTPAERYFDQEDDDYEYESEYDYGQGEIPPELPRINYPGVITAHELKGYADKVDPDSILSAKIDPDSIISNCKLHVGGWIREAPLSIEELKKVQQAGERKYTPVEPAHYDFPGGVSVAQVSQHLTSFGGQALQYVARATRLDGNNKASTTEGLIEDLEKALLLLRREIARLGFESK